MAGEQDGAGTPVDGGAGNPAGTPEKSKRAAKVVAAVIKDGILTFEVQEITVSAMMKRGPYQAETYYGSTVVKPKPAMIIQVPVGEIPGLEALQVAMRVIELACTNSVNEMMQKVQAGAVSELPKIVGVTGLTAADAPKVGIVEPSAVGSANAEAKPVANGETSVGSKFVSDGKEPEEEF